MINIELMKILVVGDLHGKDCWKGINCKNYDKVIFLGDYVDSYTLSDEVILNNIKEIIELKKANPDKIVLLLGNHDIPYLHYPEFSCSGFRASMQAELTKLFNDNQSHFQIAWQIDDYLFSHAGVTKAWFDDFLTSEYFNTFNSNAPTLSEILNNANSKLAPITKILFKAGKHRGGKGNGSVVWADKRELAYDMLSGYHQIVGHTPSRTIETISYDNYTSATFVDILDNKVEFYELLIEESRS